MTLFSMVHTRASTPYTIPALASFFAHTELARDDRFILIDNDGSFDPAGSAPFPRAELVRLEAPRSFAENANFAMRAAGERQADVVLLNNDIIFAPHWYKDLGQSITAVLSSVSNQHYQYSAGSFSTFPAMDLAQYLGHEAEFLAMAARHGERPAKLVQQLAMPFFCVRIPYEIYSVVGPFDETFGRAGAEDTDYCVRVNAAGFSLFLVDRSFVLHFVGKSTWRGAESPQETSERDRRYRKRFEEKWGAAISRLFIDGANQHLNEQQRADLQSGNSQRLVHALAKEAGAVEWLAGAKPRLAAVMCVYDDWRWLPYVVRAAYPALDRIFFLVGRAPWNGTGGEPEETLAAIAELADPDNKLEIVRGAWKTEADQRNAGIELLRERGFEYCMVLDADEVYETADLARMLALVFSRRSISSWRVPWFTYWKSHRYRIEPPEGFKPLVLVRVDRGQFTDKREVVERLGASVAPAVLVCHHLSYARSDEEVLRKITTFSHAHQLQPGWFERVWKGWDRDRAMENLNPCWPEAYRRAIPQPEENLPTVLRGLPD